MSSLLSAGLDVDGDDMVGMLFVNSMRTMAMPARTLQHRMILLSMKPHLTMVLKLDPRRSVGAKFWFR